MSPKRAILPRKAKKGLFNKTRQEPPHKRSRRHRKDTTMTTSLIDVLDLVLETVGAFDLADLQAMMNTSKSVSNIVQDAPACWDAFFPVMADDKKNDNHCHSHSLNKMEKLPRLGLSAKLQDGPPRFQDWSPFPKEFLDPRHDPKFSEWTSFVQVRALLQYKHAVYAFIEAPMDEEEEAWMQDILDRFVSPRKGCTLAQFQAACRSYLKWGFDFMGVEQDLCFVVEYGWTGMDLHDIACNTELHTLFYE